jgi:hypothetical protein
LESCSNRKLVNDKTFSERKAPAFVVSGRVIIYKLEEEIKGFVDVDLEQVCGELNLVLKSRC